MIPAFLTQIGDAALDSVALTLPESVIVALISAGTALATWLLTRRAQVKDMARRIEHKTEAAAAARRAQENAELVESRKEEVRILRELRDSLRQELKDLRDRVQLLEGELETARTEREKHSVERLEWFAERDSLRRELTEAHEEIAELQDKVRDLENLLSREALEEFVQQYGPLRKRQHPRATDQDPNEPTKEG